MITREALHRIVTQITLALTLFAIAGPLSAQTVRYIHTDVLGSVVAVTDAGRNVIERREYEPYGAQLTPTVSDGPGYTGHVQDATTGLTYMQQRYYDPGIGAFLSVDPVAVDTKTAANFCRYCYANNNPYKFTDPDGRNGVTALGGLIYETGQFLQGNGFDGQMVAGALADGYNGEGDGFASAAFQDATTFIPAGAIGGAGIKLVRLARLARAEKLAGRIATLGKEGSKGVREVTGTAKDAKKMFDTLRGANKVKEVRSGVFTAKGANGGTVTYRAASKSGEPTVNVNGVVDKVRKIKFKEP